MATIGELRIKFDGTSTNQKRDFCVHLKKQLQNSSNKENMDFLNECIRKYNAELRISVLRENLHTSVDSICNKCGKLISKQSGMSLHKLYKEAKSHNTAAVSHIAEGLYREILEALRSKGGCHACIKMIFDKSSTAVRGKEVKGKTKKFRS